MASNNSRPSDSQGNDWGANLVGKVKDKKQKGKNPLGGIAVGTAANAAAGSSPSGGSSRGGSSRGGGGSGGGGGGGGGAVDPGPTRVEARAIITSGMKDYLGREATGKEVKAFFKQFSQFATEQTGSVAGDVQNQFIEDWIEDRPKLRKEYAQNEMATRYSDVLSQVISQAREL